MLANFRNQTTTGAKLKGVQWTKIPPFLFAGTLFSTFNDLEDIAQEIPYDVLEKEFALKEIKKKEESEDANKKRAGAGLGVLSSRNVQNLTILIRGFKKKNMEIPDIIEAIRVLDETKLEPESVAEIIKWLPESEEVKKLMDVIVDTQPNPEIFDVAERFVLKLNQIGMHREKLQVLGFKLSFKVRFSSLEGNIKLLEVSCDNLHKALISGRTYQLFKYILLFGNFLNVGTNRKGFKGFKINGLTRIRELKTSDNKRTAVAVLCDFLDEKHPEICDFWSDLESIFDASKLPNSMLSSELGALNGDLKECLKSLDKVEHSTIADKEPFVGVMRPFTANAQNSLKEMSDRYQGIKKNFTQLLKLIGEDTNSSTPMLPEELFTEISNFIEDWKKYQFTKHPEKKEKKQAATAGSAADANAESDEIGKKGKEEEEEEKQGVTFKLKSTKRPDDRKAEEGKDEEEEDTNPFKVKLKKSVSNDKRSQKKGKGGKAHGKDGPSFSKFGLSRRVNAAGTPSKDAKKKKKKLVDGKKKKKVVSSKKKGVSIVDDDASESGTKTRKTKTTTATKKKKKVVTKGKKKSAAEGGSKKVKRTVTDDLSLSAPPDTTSATKKKEVKRKTTPAGTTKKGTKKLSVSEGSALAPSQKKKKKVVKKKKTPSTSLSTSTAEPLRKKASGSKTKAAPSTSLETKTMKKAAKSKSMSSLPPTKPPKKKGATASKSLSKSQAGKVSKKSGDSEPLSRTAEKKTKKGADKETLAATLSDASAVPKRKKAKKTAQDHHPKRSMQKVSLAMSMPALTVPAKATREEEDDEDTLKSLSSRSHHHHRHHHHKSDSKKRSHRHNSHSDSKKRSHRHHSHSHSHSHRHHKSKAHSSRISAISDVSEEEEEMPQISRSVVATSEPRRAIHRKSKSKGDLLKLRKTTTASASTALGTTPPKLEKVHRRAKSEFKRPSTDVKERDTADSKAKKDLNTAQRRKSSRRKKVITAADMEGSSDSEPTDPADTESSSSPHYHQYLPQKSISPGLLVDTSRGSDTGQALNHGMKKVSKSKSIFSSIFRRDKEKSQRKKEEKRAKKEAKRAKRKEKEERKARHKQEKRELKRIKKAQSERNMQSMYDRKKLSASMSALSTYNVKLPEESAEAMTSLSSSSSSSFLTTANMLQPPEPKAQTQKAVGKSISALSRSVIIAPDSEDEMSSSSGYDGDDGKDEKRQESEAEMKMTVVKSEKMSKSVRFDISHGEAGNLGSSSSSSPRGTPRDNSDKGVKGILKSSKSTLK